MYCTKNLKEIFLYSLLFYTICLYSVILMIGSVPWILMTFFPLSRSYHIAIE